MTRWTCPRCDREFGRERQAHVCVPGCTVEETFAGKSAALWAAYDRILDHLRALGPVHEDAVGVGVFLKADRKFAELRPSSRSLSVGFSLPYRIDDPRVRTPYPASAGQAYHLTRVRTPEEVDEQLLGWLAEAYDAAS